MLAVLALLLSSTLAQEATPTTAPVQEAVLVLSSENLADAEAAGHIEPAPASRSMFSRGSRFCTNGADWLVGSRFELEIEGVTLGEFQEITLPEIEVEEIGGAEDVQRFTVRALPGLTVQEACDDETEGDTRIVQFEDGDPIGELVGWLMSGGQSAAAQE